MLLKNQRDKLNFIRGITSPFIFLLPFFFGLPEGYEWLCVLGLWLLLNDINHVMHLHVHHPFTNSRIVNGWLDVSMSVATGMTASNWNIQHVYRHHNRHVKDYGDGMEWEMKKFSILGAISFSIRTIFPIFFMPIVESFQRGVLKNEACPIHFRSAFLAQVVSLVFLALLFIMNWKLALFYALPWYFLVYLTTRYIDYLNHFGTVPGKFSNSNNSVNKLYNKLGCNFGYHTAHHLYPDMHWSRLPEVHREIEQEIKSQYIKTYTWSGFAFLSHFWKILKGEEM